jgi:hypothetical protein
MGWKKIRVTQVCGTRAIRVSVALKLLESDFLVPAVRTRPIRVSKDELGQVLNRVSFRIRILYENVDAIK